MSEIITVGLDLAKKLFQVHGADGTGRAILRKLKPSVTCSPCNCFMVRHCLRDLPGSVFSQLAELLGKGGNLALSFRRRELWLDGIRCQMTCRQEGASTPSVLGED